MNEIPSAKFVQLLLEESEEIVLMEAMLEYVKDRSKRPWSTQAALEIKAAQSFLLKIGQQLYTKDGAAP